MRLNVYAEEITNETQLVTTEAEGRTFYGLRAYLESSPKLHHGAGDDDRSAITYWVRWTKKDGHDGSLLRAMLEGLLARLDEAERQERDALGKEE